MGIQVFSVELKNKPGYGANAVGIAKEREEAISRFQLEVNEFMQVHPEASVVWLQSSGASKYGSFTQLTAIISYP